MSPKFLKTKKSLQLILSMYALDQKQLKFLKMLNHNDIQMNFKNYFLGSNIFYNATDVIQINKLPLCYLISK